MKFTKKSDYALRIMQHLARECLFSSDGGKLPVPVQVIAGKSSLSLRFMQGIVSQLSKSGLLITVPGARGGIRLSRDPSTISVLDIIESVEGRINLMECIDHPSQCHDVGECSIFSTLQNAQAALIRELRSTTLHRMVAAKGGCAALSIPPVTVTPVEEDCPVLR